MRGHVGKRGITWTYVIDVGLDANGRRKQKSKGGFRTRRDAQTALTEAITAIQLGSYVPSKKLLRGHFLTDQ